MKKTLIILALAIVLAFTAFTVTHHRNKQTVQNDTPTTSTPTTSGTIQLTNASEYAPRLDISALPNILAGLNTQLGKDGLNLLENKPATIRKGTFVQTFSAYEAVTPPIQVPTIVFTVDIPSVKRSYDVRLSGGYQYPYNILYVTCPSPSELIYGAFNCNDGQ